MNEAEKLFMTDEELAKESIKDFTLDLIGEIMKLVHEQGKEHVLQLLIYY